jgi:hypothetical protein
VIVLHHRMIAVWGGVLLAVLVARVIAVFTLNVHWDEFVLLERAVTALRTGELVGGGRPGLGTLILTPFAAGCRNAVETIVRARILWTGLVLAAIVALWFLLRSIIPSSPTRGAALAAGVGLWALMPQFLHSSVQVRTDQPAILFGLLGGVALLSQRREGPWAAVAGALFGVGFLFSQKLLYVGALVATLAVGKLAMRRDWRPRREAVRAVLAGAAFLLVVLAYREIIGRGAGSPVLLPVGSQMAAFDDYRKFFGWVYYQPLLPLLVPQAVVVLCLVILSTERILGAGRVGGRYGAELVTAWLVLALGLAVLLFHDGRFPYFYMVLGLFPATVGALVVGPVLDRLRATGGRMAFLLVLWIPLAGLALHRAVALTNPTLRHQRASIDFVERNFPADARGYDGLNAFSCRRDPDPFPVRFVHRVHREFLGEDRSQSVEAMVEEFRARPVAFMIPPISHGYPPELWAFWDTRYVRYHGRIHVAGREVHGAPGWSGDFEVIVPGAYVWRTGAGDLGPLQVEGRLIDPGAVVLLENQGYYTLQLPEGGAGMFVLSLPEPPSPDFIPSSSN